MRGAGTHAEEGSPIALPFEDLSSVRRGVNELEQRCAANLRRESQQRPILRPRCSSTKVAPELMRYSLCLCPSDADPRLRCQHLSAVNYNRKAQAARPQPVMEDRKHNDDPPAPSANAPSIDDHNDDEPQCALRGPNFSHCSGAVGACTCERLFCPQHITPSKHACSVARPIDSAAGPAAKKPARSAPTSSGSSMDAQLAASLPFAEASSSSSLPAPNTLSSCLASRQAFIRSHSGSLGNCAFMVGASISADQPLTEDAVGLQAQHQWRTDVANHVHQHYAYYDGLAHISTDRRVPLQAIVNAAAQSGAPLTDANAYRTLMLQQVGNGRETWADTAELLALCNLLGVAIVVVDAGDHVLRAGIHASVRCTPFQPDVASGVMSAEATLRWTQTPQFAVAMYSGGHYEILFTKPSSSSECVVWPWSQWTLSGSHQLEAQLIVRANDWLDELHRAVGRRDSAATTSPVASAPAGIPRHSLEEDAESDGESDPNRASDSEGASDSNDSDSESESESNDIEIESESESSLSDAYSVEQVESLKQCGSGSYKWMTDAFKPLHAMLVRSASPAQCVSTKSVLEGLSDLRKKASTKSKHHSFMDDRMYAFCTFAVDAAAKELEDNDEDLLFLFRRQLQKAFYPPTPRCAFIGLCTILALTCVNPERYVEDCGAEGLRLQGLLLNPLTKFIESLGNNAARADNAQLLRYTVKLLLVQLECSVRATLKGASEELRELAYEDVVNLLSCFQLVAQQPEGAVLLFEGCRSRFVADGFRQLQYCLNRYPRFRKWLRESDNDYSYLNIVSSSLEGLSRDKDATILKKTEILQSLHTMLRAACKTIRLGMDSTHPKARERVGHACRLLTEAMTLHQQCSSADRIAAAAISAAQSVIPVSEAHGASADSALIPLGWLNSESVATLLLRTADSLSVLTQERPQFWSGAHVIVPLHRLLSRLRQLDVSHHLDRADATSAADEVLLQCLQLWAESGPVDAAAAAAAGAGDALAASSQLIPWIRSLLEQLVARASAVSGSAAVTEAAAGVTGKRKVAAASAAAGDQADEAEANAEDEEKEEEVVARVGRKKHKETHEGK